MTEAHIELSPSFSGTPLGRVFERTLSGKKAKAPIPWSSFDRTAYPEPALELAAAAQGKLAGGEYGAVPLFSRIASALAMNGAPFDLIAAAARIPGDEIRHAEQAVRMMRLLAPDAAPPPVERAPIESRWPRRVTWQVLDRIMIESAVIGETLACGLIDACATRSEDATVRAHFSAIVADEIQHARFGWYYLAYRAERWSKADKQHAANRAGAVVVELEGWFAQGRDAPRGCRDAARALGVLDTKTQRRIVKETVEDEIVPGFDALGLGASHAWRARRRA